MDKDQRELIAGISASAIEFRKAIDRLAFARLEEFFKARGKRISRNSRLKDLLGTGSSDVF